MSNLVIRNARHGETELLTNLAMRSKAYWGYSQTFMDACRNELTVTQNKIADPRYRYRVGEDRQNRVIGYAALESLTALAVELDALFVDPAHIGQGVGTLLVSDAKSIAVSMGATKIIIQGDPHATGFYLSVGAKQTGFQESSSIPGRWLPTFEINLTD